MSFVGFPDAFEKRMRQQLQDNWSKFAEAHQSLSPVSIRVNSGKQVSIEYSDSIPWAESGKYLNQRPVFTLDPLFHGGAYYVQEASSMFLEQAIKEVLDPDQPIKVLDLCAAPGGKSTHILSLINKKSLLVSNEVIRSRASILSENIQKWGYGNVIVTNSDPERFKDIEGFFDLIVLDAPCSGEGLFRKDPDAMKEWSEDNVALCSGRQKRIISDVWPSLKQNGILIYCTCTYSEAENEENLKWLSEKSDLEFVDLTIRKSWNVEQVEKGKVKGYRFYPHHVRGEGFFISVIRKTEYQKELRIKQGKKVFSPVPKDSAEQLMSWIGDASGKVFQLFHDNILMLPEKYLNEIEFLSTHLHVVHAGVTMGISKHNKIVPDHAIALSVDINKDIFQCIHAGNEVALAYLRKETISIDRLSRGFSLVCYSGIPLGWVNVLDNRINNLYPANWRIRMSG